MSENYKSNYHAEYFMVGCGLDYNNRDYWIDFFKGIAKKIVNIFAPKIFLDVGCAYGYLVEALRDLGVEAYGVDVSDYAISMVREDIKPYCFVANAVEGLPDILPEHFDCVSSIEVAEHLYEEDAQSFIHELCSYTDTVIFSSTADDFEEKTHYNVQQQEYWAKRFALEGFLRDLVMDMSFISPSAFVYKREEKTKLMLIEDYERSARLERISRKKELQSVINNKDVHINNLENFLEEAKCEREKLLSFMDEKDIHIKNLENFLEELHSEREKLLSAINDKNIHISDLEKFLEEAKDDREKLLSTINNKNIHISNLEKFLEEAKNENEKLLSTINDKDVHINNLENFLEEKQRERDAILNSTFWKMTLPAQRIVGSIKRLFSRKSTTSVTSPPEYNTAPESTSFTENHS